MASGAGPSAGSEVGAALSDAEQQLDLEGFALLQRHVAQALAGAAASLSQRGGHPCD